MSKRNHDSGFQSVKCGACGVEAVAKKGKQHRRCAGEKNAAVRPLREKLPSAVRGNWE